MSSSEEYLDNLLKALLEGESKAEPMADAQESPEAMFASIDDGPEKNTSLESIVEPKDQQTETGLTEANKAMSTDEIEEMFASMGDSIVTGRAALEEAPVSGDTVPEETALFEGAKTEGKPPEEEAELDDWALEEENLAEEPEVEDLTDDWALEEESLMEEPETEGLADDWALEEESLMEEPETEDLTDDWALEEENLAEEPETDGLTDDWALEEERLMEEPEVEDLADDWALEEENLAEEPETDSLTDDSEIAELEEWALGADLEEEEAMSGEIESGGEAQAEPEAQDWMPEEEILPEEPEEKTAENIEITEAEDILSDFMTEEEKVSEEPQVGEPVPEDFSLEDLELNDLKDDDLDLEGVDMMNDDLTTENTMSEEDVDRLLGDDFALEESGEDDEGLSALLASMDQDEDLSAINDLLEKADQGLMEDDDMLSLLGDGSVGDAEENNDEFDFWGDESLAGVAEKDITESTADAADTEDSGKKDKKKKKKERKAGKKKGQKGNADVQDGMELTEKLLANLSDEGEKKKKQGAFSKFLSFLLEDDDDLDDDKEGGRDGAGLGSLSDENAELLAELDAEDKKNAGKKGKKKKASKKDAKDKKEKKPKKAKKPQKPKKEKKVSAEETGVPEKKISRTKIIFVCLFCSSVAVCIIVVNMLIPDYMQKQEAREKYDDGQYEKVYELLYGKDLNEEEELLLQKSNVILQIDKKLKSYETYRKLNMQVEALNALIEGVEHYQMFRGDAELYGVLSEADSIYAQILAELSGNYGVSEEDALDILASEDDLRYSEKVYGIIYGTYVEEADVEQPKVRQDILPEEEEIIERLDHAEDPDSLEEPDHAEDLDSLEDSDGAGDPEEDL